jgi:hypothetical protein
MSRLKSIRGRLFDRRRESKTSGKGRSINFATVAKRFRRGH